jgi:hypothetical protein
MKFKVKMALLGVGATLFNFSFLDSSGCARFWGDFLGDALLLSMVD